MLVLTRKRSEMIQIGDNIVVKIIQTGKNTVKIGIEAPSEVRVLRSELNADTTLANPAVVASISLADRLKLRKGRVDAGVVGVATFANQ